MKKENWQNEQPVLTNDLTWASESKEEAIKERTIDFFQSGVIKNYLNEFVFGVNSEDPTSLDVKTGVAYNKDGERIIIDTLIQYNPDAPNTYSPDGLGGFVLTPQSTGSLKIPITANKYTYIFISYLETTDPSVYVLQYETSKRLYTKHLDGYIITKVESDTIVQDPYSSLGIGDSYICLGYVYRETGQNLIPTNFNYQNKKYLIPQSGLISLNNVKSDKSDRTTTYDYSQTISINDHVKAVGSGTITPNNPHGLTLNDIGLEVEVLSNHEQVFHQTQFYNALGIPTDSLEVYVNYVSTRTDELYVREIEKGDYVSINGNRISNQDIDSETQILLYNGSVLLSSGKYIVYLDSIDKKIKLASDADNTNKNYIVIYKEITTLLNVSPLNVLDDPNNLKLYEVYFSQTKDYSNIDEVQGSPANGLSNFLYKIDFRKFKLTNYFSSPTWLKFTKTFIDFKTQTQLYTTKSKLMTLPPGTFLHSIKIKPRVPMITSPNQSGNPSNLSIGTDTSKNEFTIDYDINVAESDSNYQLTNLNRIYSNNSFDIYAHLTVLNPPSQGLNTLFRGEVDIWILVSSTL